MTFDSTDVVDYNYFGLGNIAKVNYPQPSVDMTLATSSTYSGFDRFGRVIDLPWTKTTAGDLAHLKYGYDQASNRIYRENVKATAVSAKFDELYQYDGLQRLKSSNRGTIDLDSTDGNRITNPTFGENWQLDQTDNWSRFTQCNNQGSTFTALDQQRTQNKANEIEAINEDVGDRWFTPSHDRNGNMTTMPKPTALTAGYNAKYDAWNRLVKVTETTGGATVVDYQYDGLYRRTTKLVSGTTTHFYYSDQWQVLEERLDALTTAEEQFAWGIRYLDDLVLRDRDTNEDGSLDERLYAIQDANWNIIALLKDSGGNVWNVVERFEYDAYGKPMKLNPDFTPHSGTNYQWEYLFTGRRIDLETELFQYRNRYYHAELGRFISQDLLKYIDGVNLYVYLNSNPTNGVDPFGFQGEGAMAAQIARQSLAIPVWMLAAARVAWLPWAIVAAGVAIAAELARRYARLKRCEGGRRRCFLSAARASLFCRSDKVQGGGVLVDRGKIECGKFNKAIFERDCEILFIRCLRTWFGHFPPIVPPFVTKCVICKGPRFLPGLGSVRGSRSVCKCCTEESIEHIG